MNKRKIVLPILIIVLIVNAIVYTFIWNKTKRLIQFSYDNYGILAEDSDFLISEDVFFKITRRIDLSNDTRIDQTTGKMVYGKDYTEHYTFKITSEYGFLFFMKVSYCDNYLPKNKSEQYYPGSYGNRPCSITWLLTPKGWRVIGFTEVL